MSHKLTAYISGSDLKRHKPDYSESEKLNFTNIRNSHLNFLGYEFFLYQTLLTFFAVSEKNWFIE